MIMQELSPADPTGHIGPPSGPGSSESRVPLDDLLHLQVEGASGISPATGNPRCGFTRGGTVRRLVRTGREPGAAGTRPPATLRPGGRTPACHPTAPPAPADRSTRHRRRAA